VWVWKERRGLWVLCTGRALRVIGGVYIDALGTGSDDGVGGVGELLTVVMPRWCWACRRGLVQVWSFVTMSCLMWT